MTEPASASILQALDRLRPVDLAAVEAFSAQVRRSEEARRRIDEDGLIVEDSKGFATAHPALEIERAASREMRGWVDRRPDLFGAPVVDHPLPDGADDEDDLAGIE